MKTSTILKKCSPLAYAFLLLVAFVAGCNDPIFYDRPSDQSCQKFLMGQKIVLEKGILIDHTWTIEAKEFTAFSIESIAKNDNGTSTARVKFEQTSGSKVLRVEGNIVYRFHKKDGYIEFLGFQPTRFLKLGMWN